MNELTPIKATTIKDWETDQEVPFGARFAATYAT